MKFGDPCIKIPHARMEKIRRDIQGMHRIRPHATVLQVLDYVMRSDHADIEYITVHHADGCFTMCIVGVRGA